MKRFLPNEFLYQLFSLIIIVIVVHGFYVTIVRPRADAVLAEQNVRAQADTNYSAEPSFWVIIKDYEQESCFVLMFWAFAILGYKAATVFNERALLQREFLPVREGVRIYGNTRSMRGRSGAARCGQTHVVAARAVVVTRRFVYSQRPRCVIAQ
jgi:hypothetical protein